MKAWTGGQYSLYRALFGAYLAIHFLHLIPWGTEIFSNAGALPDGNDSPLLKLFPNLFILCDAPWFVASLLIGATGLSVAFAAGAYDRAAALLLWYLWACLLGRNPLISNPGIPYIGWLLLAHVFIPPAPYGSFAAAGRVDPRGGWELPRGLWTGAWILLAVGYTYSGYTKLISPSWIDGSAVSHVLENPLARPTPARGLILALPEWLLKLNTWGALALELAFVPLALFSRTRPWIWALLLGMHFGLIGLIDFMDLSFGMILVHLFTFDPAWISGISGEATVFYDGDCGLCHRWVRFALSEDLAGRFRFSPLRGETFRAKLSPDQQSGLPDSIIVHAEGALLTRSAAIFRIMEGLGGYWRIIAVLGGWIPRGLRDGAYDAIAAVRKKIFAAPKSACPMLPADLRTRFVP